MDDYQVREKVMYSKSQSLPFHICVKVIQCIIEPRVIYYFPNKEGFAHCFVTSLSFFVEKEG